MCGGSWRLSVYSSRALDDIVGGSAAPVSATATSAGAVASSSSSAAAATSVTTTAASSSTTAPSSAGPKKVYVHQMVGNTYPYTAATWLEQIQTAHAAGFDGFALNVGSDAWQWAQVASAYAAALASGTNFELFLSLDMTVLPCSAFSHADLLKNYVTQYAAHPAQAFYEGRQLVSTFAGSDCSFGLGAGWNDGWETAFKQPLKSAGFDVFFLPSIFTDPATFGGASALDGELNWNSGWPSAANDVSARGPLLRHPRPRRLTLRVHLFSSSQLDFSSDTHYMNALGSKAYMAAVRPVLRARSSFALSLAPMADAPRDPPPPSLRFRPPSSRTTAPTRGTRTGSSGPTAVSPALLDLVLPPFSQRCRLRPVLLPSHPPGLYAYRWEQLVANRDKFDLIEALTWNDYGEVCLSPSRPRPSAPRCS